MEYTAQNIAQLLDGEVEGDSNVTVSDISKIEEGKPGTLSFLANPKYSQYIYTTNSSIVLVNKDFQPEKEISPTLIRVSDAYAAFARLLDLVDPNKETRSGIHSHAFVENSATIGEQVYVAPFAYVGENAKIGKNVKIYPHVFLGKNVVVEDNTILYSGVKIYHDCVIGKNCILHGGVIVGSDGFGFAPQADNNYRKIPQLGNVVVEEDVEIGANTTIDRATIGSTIIKRGVKLDNLIQIAHNVEVGENTVICAQTGISGSTKIGSQVMIGGQAGVVGHATIADKVKIQAQSGIPASIKEEGIMVQGTPAMKIKDFLKSYVFFRKLPQMDQRLRDLEAEIKRLREEK